MSDHHRNCAINLGFNACTCAAFESTKPEHDGSCRCFACLMDMNRIGVRRPPEDA